MFWGRRYFSLFKMPHVLLILPMIVSTWSDQVIDTYKHLRSQSRSKAAEYKQTIFVRLWGALNYECYTYTTAVGLYSFHVLTVDYHFTAILNKPLINWLIDLFIGWLIDWLIDWWMDNVQIIKNVTCWWHGTWIGAQLRSTVHHYTRQVTLSSFVMLRNEKR